MSFGAWSSGRAGGVAVSAAGPSASLGSQVHPSNLDLHPHLAFSLCLRLCLPMTISFRGHQSY